MLHSCCVPWRAEPEPQQAVTSAPVGTAVWSVFTSGLVRVEGYRWCSYRCCFWIACAEFEGSFSVSWLLGPFLLPVPACSVVSLNQSSLLLGAEFPTALCRDSHEFLHVMGSLLYGACMY